MQSNRSRSATWNRGYAPWYCGLRELETLRAQPISLIDSLRGLHVGLRQTNVGDLARALGMEGIERAYEGIRMFGKI